MKSIVFSLIIFLASSFASAQEVSRLKEILKYRTLGADAFYGHVLAPAQSLEVGLSKSQRIANSNAAIIEDVGMMSGVFATTPQNKMVETVYTIARSIDSAVPGNGSHIIFEGVQPSSAFSRTLILLPKNKIKSGRPAEELMDILTSYKHSAKATDFTYEYAQPKNLTVGAISSIEGTDLTWLKQEAAAPFAEGQDYVIKKCRKLLGWRCITSLYRKETIHVDNTKVFLLYISLYDLNANKDHADFASDKRSQNQITGSTAIYIVKESAEWVMLYGVDYQYNAEKTTFTDPIQKEFQKDTDRLKQRISSDLGIDLKELK